MSKDLIAFRKKHIPNFFKGLGKRIVKDMAALEHEGHINVSCGFDGCKLKMYSEKSGECYSREIFPEYQGRMKED